MYFYSPTTGGFYLEAIHGAAMPADVVNVSTEEHAALMAGQAAGQRIVPGIDNRPELAASPPAAPLVPASVTMRQARLALLSIGKLDDVAAAIAAMPSPHRERAQIEWEYGTVIERSSPLLARLGTELGLDVDAIFQQAASL